MTEKIEEWKRIKMYYHNDKCDCDICYNQKKIAQKIFKKYGHTMLKYAQEAYKQEFEVKNNEKVLSSNAKKWKKER